MDARSLSRMRAWTESLTIGVFLCAVFAPMVDQVVRPSSVRDTKVELRAPAKFPDLPKSTRELVRFPTRFEAWHKDTFGLRDVLLHAHSLLRLSMLRSSPTPSLVLGKGDWVFSTTALAMEDHRGTLTMSPALLAEWQRFLERRRDYLAERKIEYLLVVAPSKDEVYPELLPPCFAPVGPTRLDQLLRQLEQHSDVEVLDLRSALRDEKRRDEGEDFSYYPLGIHWTDRGAYAGYAAIVRRLAQHRPDLAPLPREAFQVSLASDPGDSWADRLYLSDRLHQLRLAWSLREPGAFPRGDSATDRAAVYGRTDGRPLPRALLLHDSFGLQVRAALAEHFSELDCAWTMDLDPSRLDAIRPDVVIQLYNEGTLVRFMPVPTDEEDGDRAARRFEKSDDVLWKLPSGGGLTDGVETDLDDALARDQGTLVFEPRRENELLVLPEIEYPKDATLLLRIELETDEAGVLYAFFKTKYDPTYDRRRALRRSFAAGRSSVYLVLPPAEETGRLALRMGSMRARYRLHAMEIRRERS
jgi:hypothetical protein